MSVRGRRILITTDAVGGVWTYTLDLAAGLTAAGAILRLLVLGPPLREDQRAELALRRLDAVETGCPLEWLADDVGEVHAAAQVLAGLARDWRADLVHLHAAAFAAKSSFPCPVVVTHHSCVATWWAAVYGVSLPADFAWRTALTGEGLARADLVIAPTAAYAKAIAGIYHLLQPPRVVHNGRAARPQREGETACERVFTAGRLWDAGKNVVALDRVAALLPWPVDAAGDVTGPNGAEVSFQHLRLVGRQSEVEMRQCLETRPIFVAPALFEPFGLTVLEAAQAGCALVLNDVPTFRELWGDAAVFVQADDIEAFAEMLRVLIDDEARRHTLGSAARARAERYSLDAMVENTIVCYQTCLLQAESVHSPQMRRTA